MRKERIWSCKIGGFTKRLPAGADGPMRAAVAKAFKEITGQNAEFCFSGWAAELTDAERDVVEFVDPDRKNRPPYTRWCESCVSDHAGKCPAQIAKGRG